MRLPLLTRKNKEVTMSDDYTIRPLAITIYDRDDEALQRFFIFSVIAAGKDSDWAAAKVGHLLRNKPPGALPLPWLRDHAADPHNVLVVNRVGQYTRIYNAITEAADVDLRTATVEELDGIFGVGPKTARLFVLHSRPGAECVPLDTHILKWLRDLKVDDVPPETPQSKKQYHRLEGLALAFMKANYPGVPIAQTDLLLWARYSGRIEVVEETAGFLFE